MKDRQKIIFFIMVAVILIWIWNQFQKSDTSPKDTRPKTALRLGKKPDADKMTETQTPVKEIDLKRIIAYIDIKYDEPGMGELKDPFAKLDSRRLEEAISTDISELHLSGIIWEQEEPIALINDQILNNGDMICGFKIEEIRDNEVVLSKGPERYILKLSVPVKEEAP